VADFPEGLPLVFHYQHGFCDTVSVGSGAIHSLYAITMYQTSNGQQTKSNTEKKLGSA
jgi:hypothetical protein